MPYKFTIVDESTLQPVPAVLFFSKNGITSARVWQVVSGGVEISAQQLAEFDTLHVECEGFSSYSEPLSNVYEGWNEIRLRKNPPWLLYLGVGAAMWWIGQDIFEQTRKTK